MEIKIPREVRKYQESVVLGLSMRQFICSAIAVAIAVLAYFGLRTYLGNEGVSWVCILVALPVALIGFVTYHEMKLEHFILAWIKSEVLMPKRLWFLSDNCMYMAYQEYLSEKESIKQIKSKEKRNRKVKNNV
jgi:hypothetical protein